MKNEVSLLDDEEFTKDHSQLSDFKPSLNTQHSTNIEQKSTDIRLEKH